MVNSVVGKVLRRGTRKVTAFRMAAFARKNSDSDLGAPYRRFCGKLGRRT
jgi:hypothetical protein